MQDHELEIDQTINVTETLKKKDPEIRDVSPIHVKGKAFIDGDKVTFHLQLSGHFVLPCSRTLQDVNYPIQIDSYETFYLHSIESEEEIVDEDIHVVTDQMIDLRPIIVELLLLEVPMQVFSEEAKEMENLPSGNNWKVMTEEQFKKEHEKENKVDPRLAGLADFFTENKDNDAKK